MLFRGGAEAAIRQGIIEDDLLDAVIGLGPKLFLRHPASPAAILILRAKGSKPPERRGRVLFINADRDYRQRPSPENHLRPRDEEKITAAYRDFADIDGFAKVVAIDELAGQRLQLQYPPATPTTPSPRAPRMCEPTSTAAWPMAEIESAKDLLDQAGLNAMEVLFADRGDSYADWAYTLSPAGRETAHKAIRYAVEQKAAASPWPQWWDQTVAPMLLSLPGQSSLVGLRQQLVESFVEHMIPAGMDRFDAAGMAATWWQESFYELQTAASRGWKAVIEAGLTTAEASRDDKKAVDLADQSVIRLLAETELASKADLSAALADLNADIAAAEATGDEDDNRGFTPVKIKKMRSERTKAKRKLKSMDTSLLATAHLTLDTMPPTEAPPKAIGLLRARIERLAANHYANIERGNLAWYDKLITKYGTTLQELEAERDNTAVRLDKYLNRLGYG